MRSNLSSSFHILAIDDEPDTISSSIERLRYEGCDVTLATNPSEAVEALRTGCFDLVISDSIGLDVLTSMADGALGERNARVPVVLLTGFPLATPGMVPEVEGRPNFHAVIRKGGATTPELLHIVDEVRAKREVRESLILHTPTDSAWAAWIGSVLREDLGPVRTVSDNDPARVPADHWAAAGQVLVLVSGRGVRSRWVRAKAALAIAEGKRLLPVLVEAGVEVPEELTAVPVLDLTAVSPEEARALLLSPGQPPIAFPRKVDPPRLGSAFVDRDRPLAQLARWLGAGGKQAQVVVTGPAGVGKTALAKVFVERHRKQLEDVRWIDAVEAERAPSELRPMLGSGGLLVLDDVRDYHSVSRLIAACPTASVLLTSRDHRWGEPFCVLPLEPLDSASAIELLHDQLPAATDREVETIVSTVGTMPGHLALAASLAAGSGTAALVEQIEALVPVVQERTAADRGFYYLGTDDPAAISAFERALCNLLEGEGDSIELLSAQRGSWRRAFRRRYDPERREAIADKAERAVEVAGLAGPEGQANRDHAAAMAGLLEASADLDEVVLLAGSVLVVKVTVDGRTRACAKTLTATELRLYEERESALSNPVQALAFLDRLGAAQEVSAPVRSVEPPPLAGELEA